VLSDERNIKLWAYFKNSHIFVFKKENGKYVTCKHAGEKRRNLGKNSLEKLSSFIF
jgi:hypothetical protein